MILNIRGTTKVLLETKLLSNLVLLRVGGSLLYDLVVYSKAIVDWLLLLKLEVLLVLETLFIHLCQVLG